MPSLLLEHMGREARIKDRIKIDINQVVKVLQVLACHRVAGFIRIGEGIEEGLQRTLQELHERLLDRVLARTAQDRVLKNVRHAGRVRDRRAEGNAEDLVLVPVGK